MIFAAQALIPSLRFLLCPRLASLFASGHGRSAARTHDRWTPVDGRREIGSFPQQEYSSKSSTSDKTMDNISTYYACQSDGVAYPLMVRH
jgi:hypothetical protein